MGAPMEFRILGSLEVVDEAGARIDIRGARERALLLRLLLSPNRVVPSGELIQDVWGERPPEDPTHALRVHISRLRKVLRVAGGDGRLITRAPGYVFAAGPETLDLAKFEALVAVARAHAADGDDAAGRAPLAEALALWRGPALVDAGDTPFFQAEAARLEELRLAATEARIEADLACGRHHEIVGELDGLTRAHPLRERLWGLRMVALYRAGRPADALRAYQEVRTVLREELGLEPSPALEALEGAILRHEPGLDWSLFAPRATGASAIAGRDQPAPPVTSYARIGGVNIAYQVVGDGPIDIVLVPGFVSNIDVYWSDAEWTHVFERLTRLGRLILWDKRGTGLSDPVSRVPTLDERADDLLAVMNAAGSERAVLFGISEGGPMALLFAASHPDRVRSLVLYGVSPRFSAAADWPHGFSTREQARLRAELEQHWGSGALIEIFAPTEAGNDAARGAWGRIQRAGASPAMGLAVWDAMMATDCRDILSAVNVPTLVLHRHHDRIASIDGARHIAAAIPGARLVEAPGENHLLPLGERGPLVDEIERFVTGTNASPAADRVLTTVVCVAGSVEDSHAPSHPVDEFGGRVLQSSDSAFVAAFAAPSRAIAWASSVVRSSAATRQRRAGIHTGECEVIGDDLRGAPVCVAAAAAALADPGDVLITRTVRDLVAGADLTFAERGVHKVPELAGDWSLFAVTQTEYGVARSG